MNNNPQNYESSEHKTSTKINGVKYTSYNDVPTFRKQWFFWLCWIIFAPIALIILFTGNVYYKRGKEVIPFGIANKFIGAIFCVIWIVSISFEIFTSYKNIEFPEDDIVGTNLTYSETMAPQTQTEGPQTRNESPATQTYNQNSVSENPIDEYVRITSANLPKSVDRMTRQDSVSADKNKVFENFTIVNFKKEEFDINYVNEMTRKMDIKIKSEYQTSAKVKILRDNNIQWVWRYYDTNSQLTISVTAP